jgi:hypothetical protein
VTVDADPSVGYALHIKDPERFWARRMAIIVLD